MSTMLMTILNGRGMKIRDDFNEYGTPVSVHICPDCGTEFTVCPAVPWGEDWGGCLSESCESYDPKRDVDKYFDDPEAAERDGVEIKSHPTGKNN